MKKHLFLCLLGFVCAIGYSQPTINKVSFASSTPLFGLYEISFQLSRYDNPYDPDVIDVFAEFVEPNGNIHKVNGFYYEGYTFSKHHGYEKAQRNNATDGWRIRFTPERTGTWRFVIYAIDGQGETILSDDGSKPFTFKCESVQSGEGFITKANDKYLKRDVVTNGRRQSHSFFPVGPNVAWYSCKSYYNYSTPMGIYDYEMYIDSLAGNANYMRIWLSRYQYLSLYGPEYALGDSIMYFNSTLNQKDAAELDHIINYATQHGISVMPCLFSFGDFTRKGTDTNGPGKWSNNPFHSELGLRKPHRFFSSSKAKKVTKNLIRYIVARWGYSPQIMAWELWNEVSNMDIDVSKNRFQRKVTRWHNEMAEYLHSVDPFGHLVTTSIGSHSEHPDLYKNIFRQLDFVQLHSYQNIDKAVSTSQFSYKLLGLSQEDNQLYPTLPFFIGEFGFGKVSTETNKAKDPYGVDLHNSLWSSLFSGSMGPASFWYWSYLRKAGLFHIFKPIRTFCEDMPIPSASFTGHTTGKVVKRSLVFPNNIETYYMLNANEDTIYGWSQDTAFCYQSLRHLTEKTTKSHFQEGAAVDKSGYLYTMKADKRPAPSSTSNGITLPITRQPVGAQYTITWYSTETGLELTKEKTTATVEQSSKGKAITFMFPASIRDLRSKKINNTFGDAVFRLTLTQKEGSNGNSPAPQNKPTLQMKHP